MKKNLPPCLKPALVLGLVLISCPLHSFGQATYSYLDENGTRVLTNIAPTRPVSDLKVSGVPRTPEAKPVAVTRAGAQGKAARKAPVAAASVANSRKAAPPVAAAGVPDLVRTVGEPAAPKMAAQPARPGELGPIIEEVANQYQLDPKLVRAVIATESGFQNRAVSPKGALGLMQLMPATAARLGVKDPFDPEQNIRGGTKHLRFLMDTFDNKLDLSLAAYNAGENLVLRLGRVPNIRETRDYVRLVTARYGQTYMDQVTAAEAAAVPSSPPVFRYLDPSGVLVLTNIPPSGYGGTAAQNVSNQANLPQ